MPRYVFKYLGAFFMSHIVRKTAFFCPAAVSVHNNSYMLWQKSFIRQAVSSCRNRSLDFHNFFLFVINHFDDFCNKIIGELLNILFDVLLFVLGDELILELLFEEIIGIAAMIADIYLFIFFYY